MNQELKHGSRNKSRHVLVSLSFTIIRPRSVLLENSFLNGSAAERRNRSIKKLGSRYTKLSKVRGIGTISQIEMIAKQFRHLLLRY